MANQLPVLRHASSTLLALTRHGVDYDEARGAEDVCFDAERPEVLQADVEGRRQPRAARAVARKVAADRPRAVEGYVIELRDRILQSHLRKK